MFTQFLHSVEQTGFFFQCQPLNLSEASRDTVGMHKKAADLLTSL